jgi:phosphoserine aminotransferase
MQKRLFICRNDRNPLFKGAAAVEDRSNMNATFLLNDAHMLNF